MSAVQLGNFKYDWLLLIFCMKKINFCALNTARAGFQVMGHTSIVICTVVLATRRFRLISQKGYMISISNRFAFLDILTRWRRLELEDTLLSSVGSRGRLILLVDRNNRQVLHNPTFHGESKHLVFRES